MRIPDHLLPPEEREKRAARRRAAQRVDEHVGQTHWGQRLAQGRPAIVGLLILLVALASALLVGRTKQHARAASPKKRPPEAVAGADLRVLRIALERFRFDCRRYPTSADGLRSLVQDHGFIGWRGNYVNLVRPDPWRRVYVYRSDGKAVQTLLSVGRDGREGTSDDVVPLPFTAEDVAGPDGKWAEGGTNAVATNALLPVAVSNVSAVVTNATPPADAAE